MSSSKNVYVRLYEYGGISLGPFNVCAPCLVGLESIENLAEGFIC